MSIKQVTETTRTIDAEGNETVTTVESTTNIQRNEEPDYIKLYTRMWCEFNNIPVRSRNLFYELACSMTYCNAANLRGSQIVYTGEPLASSIMQRLGWKKSMYHTGLKDLCECGAIRKIQRGVYQINPQYAGKGEWHYNPRYQRGGVAELVATFRFADRSVDTNIVWADDGSKDDMSDAYRAMVGNNKIIKSTRISAPAEPEEPEPTADDELADFDTLIAK